MELVLLFFASFGFVIILFLIYSGFFKPVIFKTIDMPKLTLALLPFQGDYKDSAPLQVEVMKLCQGAEIKITNTAGIYFDDPKKVAKEELRSLVGVVITEDQIETVKGLHSDIEIVSLENVKAFHTKWIYKTGLSITLAILKVYPAMKRFSKREGFQIYQSIEVYDFPNKELNYYFPKQDKETLWKVPKKNYL